MPDSTMETQYDLRKPGARDELQKHAIRFVQKRKSAFTSRELAEACSCNTVQARNILDEMIASGSVTYEGTTRDMTYQRVE